MKNKTLQNELQDLLGDRFSESTSVRTNYAGGEDVFDPVLSEAVVFPQSNEEISSIVKLCNKHKDFNNSFWNRNIS
jgi:D-lactate dehydrogenase (cytochrome)